MKAKIIRIMGSVLAAALPISTLVSCSSASEYIVKQKNIIQKYKGEKGDYSKTVGLVVSDPENPR
jgi:hypothetical protein